MAILGLIRDLAYGRGRELGLMVSPNPAYPGDLVLLEIKGVKLDDFSKVWLGKKIVPMFRVNNRLIGLAVVPLGQESTEINTVARVNENNNFVFWGDNLKIRPIIWPERRVGETMPLSPKKLARYLKEKALIKKALETTAEEPLWQTQFLPAMSLTEETSPFGQKRIGPTKTRQHRGVDLRAHIGTPVRSMNNGRVVLTGNFLADGKIVIIDHGLGLHTLYLHLSRIKVKKRQVIKRGQVLGFSGNTGFSEGPHLHLEIRLNGEAINPTQILEILK